MLNLPDPRERSLSIGVLEKVRMGIEFFFRFGLSFCGQ